MIFIFELFDNDWRLYVVRKVLEILEFSTGEFWEAQKLSWNFSLKLRWRPYHLRKVSKNKYFGNFFFIFFQPFFEILRRCRLVRFQGLMDWWRSSGEHGAWVALRVHGYREGPPTIVAMMGDEPDLMGTPRFELVLDQAVRPIFFSCVTWVSAYCPAWIDLRRLRRSWRSRPILSL